MAHAATSCGTVACDQAYLVQLLGPAAAACMERVIGIEDPSYNPLQANLGGSGAYGIPQALPGGKMSSAGPDWATNPQTQLRWMAGYVRAYGGACGALIHEQAYGWY